MATTADTDPDQDEKMSSPSEDDGTPVLSGTSAPLDFSALTPCQFGISVHSFSQASSNRKDKSRLAQIKARRRSSIGVRGSPETNSLIRFMAQQRMKTPPTHQTSGSHHVRSSPFLPRVASTLRQKMASFQSLMDVEESEVCDPVPRQDSNSGECIKTRDYLSDDSQDRGKENNPPMMSLIPSKRRCLRPREGCKGGEEPVVQILTEGPLPSFETAEEAEAVLISPPIHLDSELQDCSSTKNQQQDNVFELQSPSQPMPDHPAASSPARPAPPFTISSLPSLMEMEPKENESTGTPAAKKKKVRFGGPLSPELFDKNLPPSTPIQKGGTPARAPTPGGVLQMRSLLKTPQRTETRTQTPPAQSDLSSLSEFGASPTLVLSHNSRMASVGNYDEDEDGKIIFPSTEEIDSALTNEDTWETKPLNLNRAFFEESLSQIVTESETKPSATSQTEVLDEPDSQPDQDEVAVEASAPVRSCNRRKKPGPGCETTIEAPTRSSSRKRKQPEESEPVKRSTRSAAKSASGKMKMSSKVIRQWNRDVDRSLYGSREYASKNPNLSPITERLSFISQSPAAQQTPSAGCTAVPDHEASLNPETSNNLQAFSVMNTLENPSEASTRRAKRLSGPKVRGRRLKKRKVSVVDCEEPEVQTGRDTEEECEDQTTTNPEASIKTPLKHTAPEQGAGDTEPNDQTSADTASTDSEKTSECQTSQSACPSSGEQLGCTLSLAAEPAQRKAKRGRRSSMTSSVLQEQGDKVEDYQMSCASEEKAQAEQAASQHESRSSSDSQEDESAAPFQLAPWQADFNFEDVFKPVATRGQRSVRRSLRNQGNVVHNSSGAGLAWMPRTSPDSGKEACRRTRGRRRSAALPVQPSFPEET